MAIKIKTTLSVLLATSVYSASLAALEADFYSLERVNDDPTTLTNPIIPLDIYIDKNTDEVNVKFEFDKTNSTADAEACVTINFVQILTNRDIPTDFNTNGEPIVTQWETVWEREEIRTSVDDNNVEPLNIDLLRDYCLAQNEVNDYSNWHKTRGDSNEWSFVLGQGWDILGGRHFNSSTDYQDAELRVGVVYFPKRFPYEASVYTPTHVGTLENKIDRDDEWQIAFKAEVTLSLHDTIPVVEEVYDHRLKELSAISGYTLPVAYIKDVNGGLGCYGTYTPTQDFLFGATLGGYYNCLLTSSGSDIDDVPIVDRTDHDVIIMCPGSMIQPHVDYEALLSQGAKVPTAANSPFPQVLATSSHDWCQNIEKIERSWTDLTSIAEEGWMVSINQQTGNLECIASNGVCANSLVDSIKLRDIDTAQEALLLETIVLTGSSQDCRYQDNSVSACPSDFYISAPSLTNLVSAFQLSAFQDLNTLLFDKGGLTLYAGDQITTQNRRLQMQHDGNLVLYRYVDGAYDGALWASNTNTGSDYRVRFQDDGNFVLYNSVGSAQWDSKTHGNRAGDILKLQGDGDLVIYSSTGEVLWSTGTAE